MRRGLVIKKRFRQLRLCIFVITRLVSCIRRQYWKFWLLVKYLDKQFHNKISLLDYTNNDDVYVLG